MNEIAIPEVREGHIHNSLLSMEHFPHYMKVAEMLSKSTMIPKNMVGKPADILIAMDMALQLGIPLLQGIQDIAVINGRPCIWGDGLLAVAQGHKDYEWLKENVTNGVATCTIKRKNHDAHTATFSMDDAKKAGLWGKSGPWTQYPERMLTMRARGFAVRNTFADALRGIKSAEEVQDYVFEGEVVKPKAADQLKSLLESKKAIKTLSNSVQHDDIMNLIHERGFTHERLEKALMHYQVNSVIELCEADANAFIAILKKEPLVDIDPETGEMIQ